MSEQQTTYLAHAHGLIAALDEYEETHPAGVPCFRDELESMKAKVQAP